MTETRPCACGCGELVTRQVGNTGYLNAHWYVDRSHLKRKRAERHPKRHEVNYRMGLQKK